MKTHAPPIRSGLGFLRYVGFWVLVPVGVYVAYVAVDAAFWPGRDRLSQLAARLPFIVGQIIPVAVFAATTGRSALFGGGDGGKRRSHLWIAVALVAGAAYATLALVDPLLAPFTGSDALFPRELDHAADAAREAGRITTGPESEARLREAGGYLMQLVVPFTTAAMVFVAAGLGSFVGIRIPGATSSRGLPEEIEGAAEVIEGAAAMVRAATTGLRSVAVGIFAGAYWSSLRIAGEVAGDFDLSAAVLFALMLGVHLTIPMLILAVVVPLNWRSDR
jgi:hypothetical protein